MKIEFSHSRFSPFSCCLFALMFSFCLFSRIESHNDRWGLVACKMMSVSMLQRGGGIHVWWGCYSNSIQRLNYVCSHTKLHRETWSWVSMPRIITELDAGCYTAVPVLYYVSSFVRGFSTCQCVCVFMPQCPAFGILCQSWIITPQWNTIHPALCVIQVWRVSFCERVETWDVYFCIFLLIQ